MSEIAVSERETMTMVERRKKVDELANALEFMFGGTSDGYVYAKAIECETVRRLLHELLDAVALREEQP